MEREPTVSVIIPTYNRSRLVGRAVGSVLAQTYRQVEAVVVDDGSTDDTAAVIRRIAAGASRPVRYVKKPNGGCASARNLGVRHAAGEFVMFLDSDDELLPEAAESLLGALLGADADFVYSPSIEVGLNGRTAVGIPAAPGGPERFARDHFFTLRSRSCCNLFRRGVFDAVRFNEAARYNEDSDFLQRVAIRFQAAYSPRPTAKVFQHGGNKSSDQRQICRALVVSYESILRDHPDFASSLGLRAARRIDRIKTDLIAVLVREHALDEARAVAATLSGGALIVNAALRYQASFPFILRRYYYLLKYLVEELLIRIAYKRTLRSGMNTAGRFAGQHRKDTP